MKYGCLIVVVFFIACYAVTMSTYFWNPYIKAEDAMTIGVVVGVLLVLVAAIIAFSTGKKR
jgi:uncharacterized membrane protein